MNKEVNYLKLYEMERGRKVLVLGNNEPQIVHAFTKDYLYIAPDYNVGAFLNTKSIRPLDIDGFKYIKNLKKFCVFGLKLVEKNYGNNADIRFGLVTVVKVLVTNNITPQQVKYLNDTYDILIKNGGGL